MSNCNEWQNTIEIKTSISTPIKTIVFLSLQISNRKISLHKVWHFFFNGNKTYLYVHSRSISEAKSSSHIEQRNLSSQDEKKIYHLFEQWLLTFFRRRKLGRSEFIMILAVKKFSISSVCSFLFWMRSKWHIMSLLYFISKKKQPLINRGNSMICIINTNGWWCLYNGNISWMILYGLNIK